MKTIKEGNIAISGSQQLERKASAFENIKAIRGQKNNNGEFREFDYKDEYNKFLDERYQVK